MLRAGAVVVALVAVIAVVVLAITDSFTGDEAETAPSPQAEEEADLVGPHTPPDGALDGRLIVSRGDECVLQVIDLRDLSLGRPGPRTGCGLWASPDGERAVVLDRSAAFTVELRGINSFWVANLGELRVVSVSGEEPRFEQALGVGNGPIAWSPDGASVAGCSEEVVAPSTDGQASDAGRQSLVVELESGATRIVPGCEPLFEQGGSVITRGAGARLLRDGVRAVGVADLRQGLGEDAVIEGIIGYDRSPDGGLVLLVDSGAGPDAGLTLQFWRAGELERSVDVPEPTGIVAQTLASIGRVRLSPDGQELALSVAVGESDESATEEVLLGLIDTATGELAMGQRRHHGFDWSPDSRWFAISTGEEIEIHGSVRDAGPVWSLPVESSAFAWR